MISKNLKGLVTTIDNDGLKENFLFKENRDGVNGGCGLRKEKER